MELSARRAQRFVRPTRNKVVLVERCDDVHSTTSMVDEFAGQCRVTRSQTRGFGDLGYCQFRHYVVAATTLLR